MAWGTQSDAIYVPEMRTQLVAARTVAEALADVATDGWPASATAPIPEIAGPREESLVAMARLLATRRGDTTPIHGVATPTTPTARSTSRARCFPGRTPPLPGRRSRSGSASGSERVTSRAGIRQADAVRVWSPSPFRVAPVTTGGVPVWRIRASRDSASNQNGAPSEIAPSVSRVPKTAKSQLQPL